MYYQSPVGQLSVNISEGVINEIMFIDKADEIKSNDHGESVSKKDKNTFEKCRKQLDEYFSGKRIHFDLPFQQLGTPFQKKVWDELVNIPFGKPISYLQLARRIGNIKAIRAIGKANGSNRISIIVPCHRVIGSDGSLTGYAGGLWRKQWLLEHENKYANGVALLF
ncbi:MAG: methylated-DNA--[protein]-cysteine S-methyltransferase [Bacteroidota bacterium]|jgi:methylated-DNA-[protein]-cysteine S-methyltransferase|nr:methylated-DNA--[protein]-cysteine S-methyltransferase [Bacteroidota bacterium]